MGWRSGQRCSQDLRDRVLSAVDGEDGGEVGSSGPNPNRSHEPRKPTAAQEMALAGHMRSHPGITPASVQTRLEADHGVFISTGAVWNAVRRRGPSFKKSPEGRRAGPAGRGSPPADVEGRPALH